jgi:hypothetical protein
MTTHTAGRAGGRKKLQIWAIVAALCAQTSLVFAQSATAPVLTAAFLFSFAKFTAWPADTLKPTQDLSLCVVGDSAVRDALEQTIEGHAIDGHQLTVRILKADSSPASCHLLFVSASEVTRAELMLTAAKESSMFTVSDAERFADSGGVAQLVREKDRMRFTVNLTAARRARLTLSSRLLSLARVIQE